MTDGDSAATCSASARREPIGLEVRRYGAMQSRFGPPLALSQRPVPSDRPAVAPGQEEPFTSVN